MKPPTARPRVGWSAFSLIEVLVVVTIVGILAALALPALQSYVRKSKTGEATQNLSNLFKSAQALYSAERATAGIDGTLTGSCVAEPTALTPASPNNNKQKFTAQGGFVQLNFSISDYVYYGYGINSVGTAGNLTCLQNASGTAEIYTFFAIGDLDADGITSTFELPVGSDGDNQLYHSRGFFVMRETE